MPKLLLTLIPACALVLFGFGTSADAAPQVAPQIAPSVLILVQDDENAEVETLLEPDEDKGTPMDAEGGDNGENKGAGAATKGATEKEYKDGEEKEVDEEEGK